MKPCIKQNRRPWSNDNRYFSPLWDQDYCLAGDGWFQQVPKPSGVPNLVAFDGVTCLVREAGGPEVSEFQRQEVRHFH